jgi:hypothetical protein
MMVKNVNKKDGLNTICLDCMSSHDKTRSSEGVYRSMIKSSKKRGHAPPSFTKETFCQLRKENLMYRAGWLTVQMTLEPGYWNTSSPDRFDDSKGYNDGNFRFRPLFLNTRYAFTDDEIKQFPALFKEPYTPDNDILDRCAKYSNGREGVLYISAGSAIRRDRINAGKRIGKTETRRKPDIAAAYLKMAQRQEYRCNLSGLPMLFETNSGARQVSVDRIDPCKTYGNVDTQDELDNVQLICLGFQMADGAAKGRFTDEERQDKCEPKKIPANLFSYKY